MASSEQLKDDRAFYFDFLKAQIQVIAQRNQFLLFFQSILFASFAGLIGKELFFPLWLIPVLGLTVSLVWLYVNAMTHSNEAAIERI